MSMSPADPAQGCGQNASAVVSGLWSPLPRPAPACLRSMHAWSPRARAAAAPSTTRDATTPDCWVLCAVRLPPWPWLLRALPRARGARRGTAALVEPGSHSHRVLCRVISFDAGPALAERRVRTRVVAIATAIREQRVTTGLIEECHDMRRRNVKRTVPRSRDATLPLGM